MNKIKYLVLLLVVGILTIFWTIKKKERALIVNISQQSSSFPCPVECLTLKVDDPAMSGILEAGATVILSKNHYAYNPLKRGDLVYFRYHNEQAPVVRVVRGIAGDHFEVIKDSKGNGWNIRVNGEFLKVGKGEDLVYGSPAFLPPLGLAAKSHNNTIAADEVILLTNSSSGKFDSTLMGLLSLKDIIGKITIETGESQKN